MEDANNSSIAVFDKIKRPLSILCGGICFITVYSALELARHFISGHPLRESTLILTTLWGIGAIICWLIIDHRIRKIKKNIQ